MLFGEEVGKNLRDGFFVADGAGGLADFEFAVGKVTFKDADFGAAFAEEKAEVFGGGAAVFGFEDGFGKFVVNETGGGEFLQQKFGVAFVEEATAGFEEGVSGAFGGESEASAHLDGIGAEDEGGLEAGARGDATGCDERKGGGLAHEGDETECGCFFAAVVATGFEAFGNDGVYTGLGAFAGEKGVGDDVGD